MMANLVAHQVAAEDDPRCLVQGSPWAVNSDRLFVRDTNNFLREWQRNDNGRWEVADLTTAGCGEITSDPRYFQEEYFKTIERRDKAGNPVLNGAGDPIVDGLEGALVERIIARGKDAEGKDSHLFECKRQQLSSLTQGEEPTKGDWQRTDLTEKAENGQEIALTPSPPAKPSFFSFFSNDKFFGDEKTQPQIFTRKYGDDQLLVWSLPRLSDDKSTLKEILEADERKWEVKNLTTEGNGQTSAGNSNITVPSFLFDNSLYIFTRNAEGHLFIGWPFSEQEPVEQLVDLTDAVGGKSIIVGDPAGYAEIFKTDTNQLLALQYVFARNSQGNLLAWRHQLEEEIKIPTEGYDNWRRQTIEPGWNNLMRSGWENVTEKMGGETIKGDPTVYVKENADFFILNVLAQGSNDHLLKWSLKVLSKSGKTLFFDEDSKWEFEDLTETAAGGKPIIGEPMTVFSPNSSLERIFVEGENNHLLEWRQDSDLGHVFWQVTDLTESCEPTGGLVKRSCI